MRRGPALAVLLALFAPASSRAEEALGGRALAQARCSGCHALAPGATAGRPEDPLALDGALGPDLWYAGTKFDSGWLAGWLAAPRRLRPAGHLHYRAVVTTPSGDCVDPVRLPAHPVLAPAEAAAVAGYLLTLRRDPDPFPISAPNKNLRAEIQFHKLLPCGGCHQSHPGQGGLSGPELYTARRRLKPDWGTAYLADPVSWGPGQMPKLHLRSDILASLSELLFAPAAEPAPAPAPALRDGACAGGQPPPAPKGRAAMLYRVLCSQCHGVLGNGRGINAPSLFVAPRNHSSPREMEMLRREDIVTAIRGGGAAVGKSDLMPAWGARLSQEDIEGLADLVMGLSRSTPSSKGEP